MKLGRDTGSVTNWLMSGTKGEPTPEVGMGVTVLMWTDRKAGTITRVSPSGKTFWFKDDIAIRTDSNGMSESQTYEFKPDPDARERKAVKTVKGWKEVRGSRLMLGHRSAYHDYSF
jgi:hypothetical protein